MQATTPTVSNPPNQVAFQSCRPSDNFYERVKCLIHGLMLWIARLLLFAGERSALDRPLFVKHDVSQMKSASVRDLRHHFGNLLTWIREGQEIKITMRRRVVARLVPERPVQRAPIKMPDFAKRLKKIHGRRTISSAAARALLAENKGKY
jgi:antitoxin (DNA-binding transcriptional repressor) of toxin-antitoxin stability system